MGRNFPSTHTDKMIYLMTVWRKNANLLFSCNVKAHERDMKFPLFLKLAMK